MSINLSSLIGGGGPTELGEVVSDFILSSVAVENIIVTAANNPNGIYLAVANLSGNGGPRSELLAGSNPLLVLFGGGNNNTSATTISNIMIPPNTEFKAVYLTTSGACRCVVNYTIL